MKLNMREETNIFFGKLCKAPLFFIAFLLTSYRLFVSHLRLQVFLRREQVIHCFSERYFITQPKNDRIFIVITHVVQEWEAKNPENGSYKIQRLSQVIDGLLSSFAHCDLKIVVNTWPERNIISFLKPYMQEKIMVREADVENPMMAGHYAQEIMIDHKDDFDWFLFLEDDIVIKDSLFLEKLVFFNTFFCYNNVLIPNRYEMFDGAKHYIDMTSDSNGKPLSEWNALSTIDIGGIKFSECQNTHGGMYCLTKQQLQKWIDSGRYWYKKNVSTGPLESAATFCLFECFNLYKPHYSNMYFLEVLHYDVKYSKAPYRQLPVA